ncbi:hypothetical protein [Bradyrhizobium ottawaense]
MADPALDNVTRDHFVDRLMVGRQAVRDEAEATPHRAVDEVKRALG